MRTRKRAPVHPGRVLFQHYLFKTPIGVFLHNISSCFPLWLASCALGLSHSTRTLNLISKLGVLPPLAALNVPSGLTRIWVILASKPSASGRRYWGKSGRSYRGETFFYFTGAITPIGAKPLSSFDCFKSC